MKKIKNWILNHLPTKRRLIQLYSALLFNANLKGFGKGRIYGSGGAGVTKNVCTPGLNCYSCPGATGACPLGSLQNALTGSADAKAATYVIGILLLYGFLFGRWICGFLCPFGLIQDLLHKIPTPKLKKNRVTRALSFLKYVILVVFVFIFPLMYAFRDFPLPAFCKYICPAGTLEGGIGLLANKVNESSLSMLGPLFTWKFVLLLSFLVAAIFIYRVFCRFFCPLGALYGLFNKVALFGIKLEKPKCIDCGKCISKCEMDIRHVGDHECINCGACIPVCPTKAITWKGSQVFIAPNEVAILTAAKAEEKDPAMKEKAEAVAKKVEKRKLITKIVAVVLMLSVLAGALVYYNFIDKLPEVPPVTVDPGDNPGGALALPGNNVGNLCFGASIPLYSTPGTTFNPAENMGKVTVINFWGEWCGPCKEELPHFDELAKEYGDKVTFLLLSGDVDPEKDVWHMQTTFPDTTMLYGHDAGDAYYYQLGGTGAWPTTLVLDANGVIVAKYPKKLSKEELAAAIEKAIAATNTQ